MRDAKSKTGAARVATGFAAGLAQMFGVSGSLGKSRHKHTQVSASEALRGDWKRLGGDLHRATTKVVARRLA